MEGSIGEGGARGAKAPIVAERRVVSRKNESAPCAVSQERAGVGDRARRGEGEGEALNGTNGRMGPTFDWRRLTGTASSCHRNECNPSCRERLRGARATEWWKRCCLFGQTRHRRPSLPPPPPPPPPPLPPPLLHPDLCSSAAAGTRHGGSSFV
jgi:hypothetical protein